MFSKIIFVLAVVCVVNASVLAVNDNEEPETDVGSNPKKCNYQECHQRCRRLKFPGGSCVNGRCKCDNFLNAEDGDSENSPSYLENYDLQDYPETEVKANMSGCNNKVCDWVCRRLNKTSGICVNGRCKCEKSLFAEVSNNSLSNLEDTVSTKRCTFEACNALCHKLNFREGVCDGGRCRCNNYFARPKDEVSEESLPVSESLEDQTERGCNMQACDQLCRRLKFTGGVCVNGRCKCDHFFRAEGAVDEYSELDTRRICKITKCNRKCTRRGYEGATCVDGRCKCYKSPETSLPVSELLDDDDQTERGCNMQACDKLCRRLKFTGGVCVEGRCKCNNFLGTKDTVDEYSELEPRRICELRKCNRTCTRRGYASSRCVNGWCRCYQKVQREDASPLNDVTSDESDELNELFRTNEEELIPPSPSACNSVSCNQWCRRLKYAGGWCRLGQCQCF